VASGRLILPGGPLVGDSYLVPLGEVERVRCYYLQMPDQGLSFARNYETVLFLMVTGFDQTSNYSLLARSFVKTNYTKAWTG
jgi:hypothetical protein